MLCLFCIFMIKRSLTELILHLNKQPYFRSSDSTPFNVSFQNTRLRFSVSMVCRNHIITFISDHQTKQCLIVAFYTFKQLIHQTRRPQLWNLLLFCQRGLKLTFIITPPRYHVCYDMSALFCCRVQTLAEWGTCQRPPEVVFVLFWF